MKASQKLTDHRSVLSELEAAASSYMKAMEGFAEAVRQDSGLAYPWPAQDASFAKLSIALERAEILSNDGAIDEPV